MVEALKVKGRFVKVSVAPYGETYKLPAREVIGEEPCPGEAHENPYIDHCGLCMPRWGVIPVYAPVPVKEALSAGLAVPVARVEEGEVEKLLASGEAVMVWATLKEKWGLSSFNVLVKGG